MTLLRAVCHNWLLQKHFVHTQVLKEAKMQPNDLLLWVISCVGKYFDLKLQLRTNFVSNISLKHTEAMHDLTKEFWMKLQTGKHTSYLLWHEA